MILLAIETSCDETAVAIIKRMKGKKVKFKVLSNKILSQVDLHAKYGGVFPNLAKREHSRTLTQLVAEALNEAGLLTERSNIYHIPNKERKSLEKMLKREKDMLSALKIMFEGIQKPKIDAMAVTEGPGLEPALWVGINSAIAMNMIWNIPIYPINHMEGHIVASTLSHRGQNFEIENHNYPALALLISGGHTEIVNIQKNKKYKVLGKTRDDAVGEAFDKVARMLGLKYPGGPEISRLAEIARKEGLYADENLKLPRPMINSKDLNFSFSGLKTATMTRVKKIGNLDEKTKKVIALEFENSVTEVLIAKIKQAVYENKAKTVIVGGGVSANLHIRRELKKLSEKDDFALFIPEKDLSTDNALMIASTGLLHISKKIKSRAKLKANGSWSVENC